MEYQVKMKWLNIYQFLVKKNVCDKFKVKTNVSGSVIYRHKDSISW